MRAVCLTDVACYRCGHVGYRWKEKAKGYGLCLGCNRRFSVNSEKPSTLFFVVLNDYPNSLQASADLFRLVGKHFSVAESDDGQLMLWPAGVDFPLLPRGSGAVCHAAALVSLLKARHPATGWHSLHYFFTPDLKQMKILTRNDIKQKHLLVRKKFFVSVSGKNSAASFRISIDLRRHYELTTQKELVLRENDAGEIELGFQLALGEGYSLHEGVEDGTLGFNSKYLREFLVEKLRLKAKRTYRLVLEPLDNETDWFSIVKVELQA